MSLHDFVNDMTRPIQGESVEYTPEFIDETMKIFNGDLRLRVMLQSQNPAALTYIRRHLNPINAREIIDIFENPNMDGADSIHIIETAARFELGINEILRKANLLDVSE